MSLRQWNNKTNTLCILKYSLMYGKKLCHFTVPSRPVLFWVIPKCLEGLYWNLGQIITTLRQCTETTIWACGPKVKVTVEGQRFEHRIPCLLCNSLQPWKFIETWVKCTPHWDNVQNSPSKHAGPRSQLKVKVLSLKYHVHSSTPKYLNKYFN